MKKYLTENELMGGGKKFFFTHMELQMMHWTQLKLVTSSILKRIVPITMQFQLSGHLTQIVD